MKKSLKEKFLTFAIAGLLAMSVLTGCSQKDTDNTKDPSGTDIENPNPNGSNQDDLSNKEPNKEEERAVTAEEQEAFIEFLEEKLGAVLSSNLVSDNGQNVFYVYAQN